MVLRFKKVNDFERKSFFQEFEHHLEDGEKDIYVVDELEEKVDNDLISPSEMGFMVGYLMAMT